VPIKHAGKPRTQIINFSKLRDFWQQLDENILYQILGAILGSGKSKRQPEKTIQVRPKQGFEFRSIFVRAVYWNISFYRQLFWSTVFS